MSTNPLVAGPVDTATTFSGAGLLDDVTATCSALRSGSWLDATLSGVGTAMDLVATVSDPLGSLIGAGLGWLMDHLEPLKGWLNDLVGDAGAVLGFAGTWDNVATAVGSAGDEMARVVRADLEAMSGASIDAYTAYADELVAHLHATSDAGGSLASALRLCSTVVQVVHDLVRDTLSQLVGSIISWAAEAVFSLGLATPWIVEQVSTRVASLATRIGTKVTGVVSSSKALSALLKALKAGLARLRLRRPGAAAPGPKAPEPRTPRPDGSPATGGTAPSRPPDPDATPGGRRTPIGPREDADTTRSLTRENESADQLAQHGYDVEQNPSVPGAKNPDYRIEGQIFDNVAPVTGNVRNIYDCVLQKVTDGQTSRIVLNLDDSPAAIEAVEKQFRDWPMAGLDEVIVLKGGRVTQVYP